jgi:hypothetical protein
VLQIANLRHAAGAMAGSARVGRKCMRRSRIQPVGNLHGIIKTAETAPTARPVRPLMLTIASIHALIDGRISAGWLVQGSNISIY